MKVEKRWELKVARMEEGLTPQQVAQAIGMSISTYYKLEQGVRKPSITTALKIADVLNCKVEEIFK